MRLGQLNDADLDEFLGDDELCLLTDDFITFEVRLILYDIAG